MSAFVSIFGDSWLPSSNGFTRRTNIRVATVLNPSTPCIVVPVLQILTTPKGRKICSTGTQPAYHALTAADGRSDINSTSAREHSLPVLYRNQPWACERAVIDECQSASGASSSSDCSNSLSEVVSSCVLPPPQQQCSNSMHTNRQQCSSPVHTRSATEGITHIQQQESTATMPPMMMFTRFAASTSTNTNTHLTSF